ncbi:MAG: methyltransferase domain-containing protein [Ignavibacteria bacterium]|nr:methyltransferase domain-containing protein [Ignavibacteria bacterium]
MKKEKLDEVRDFHNGIAGKYDELLQKNRFSVILRSLFQKILSEYGPGGKTVLDLGCGTGDDALFISESGAVVTAVDISQNMLDAAQNKSRASIGGKNIRFVKSDIERFLNDNNTKYDLLISNFDAINYIEDIPAFSNGAACALKPGGSLIITVLNKVCLSEFFYSLLTFRFSRAYWALLNRNKYLVNGLWLRSPGEMKKLLAENFTLVSATGVGIFIPPHNLEGMYGKISFLLPALLQAEKLGRRNRFFCNFSDHYIIEMVKK